MMKRAYYGVVFFGSLILGLGVGCKTSPPETPDPPPAQMSGYCDNFNPLRNPYFGDLHVHTTFSFDAANFGVRTDPYEAYDFARGAAIGLAPYDEDDNPTRTVQLSRPLDFASVTDHSEFFAETSLCTDPASVAYNSISCTIYRSSEGSGINLVSFLVFGAYTIFPMGTPLQCLIHPDECAVRHQEAWEGIQNAAEYAYDQSTDCAFTSFVGYEYTGTTLGANLHRNVIFRGTQVAEPVSYIDAPSPEQFWDQLEAGCPQDGNGCQLLTIPHNTNLSGGVYFNPITESKNPYSKDDAMRRARLEPLIEIYQIKGASECAGGSDPLSSEDELCGFEIMGPSICSGSPDDDPNCIPLCSDTPDGTALAAFLGRCFEPSDFARGALRTGLAEQRRIGVNPFKMGFIGSTDTHNSTPGYVPENDYQGFAGASDDQLTEQLGGIGGGDDGGPIQDLFNLLSPNPDFSKFYSPGGLAVVWATENTRDALFNAMKRRETYATSGPRFIVRFFGGWNYPQNLCDRTNLLELGYSLGVPMGGDLASRTAGAGAPVFVVSALRDTGTPEMPGTQLQRIQIIKGWVENDLAGDTLEKVYEVAGNPNNGASVNTATCETLGTGFDTLCTVWTDPDFDPNQAAFYYARVVENPTCRWQQWQCNAANVDCDEIDPEDPLINCCNGSIPSTVQERAWTSPIWYTP